MHNNLKNIKNKELVEAHMVKHLYKEGDAYYLRVIYKIVFFLCKILKL